MTAEGTRGRRRHLSTLPVLALLLLGACGGDDDSEAGAPDIGGRFTIIAYLTPDGSSGGLDTTSGPWFEFADGEVTGFTGCNSFSAPYEVRGDYEDPDVVIGGTLRGQEISIGPVAATERACEDPALNDQDIAIPAALERALRWSVTADSFLLIGPDFNEIVGQREN